MTLIGTILKRYRCLVSGNSAPSPGYDCPGCSFPGTHFPLSLIRFLLPDVLCAIEYGQGIMAFESLTICMELVTFHGSDVDPVVVVDTTHVRRVIVTV